MFERKAYNSRASFRILSMVLMAVYLFWLWGRAPRPPETFGVTFFPQSAILAYTERDRSAAVRRWRGRGGTTRCDAVERGAVYGSQGRE